MKTNRNGEGARQRMNGFRDADSLELTRLSDETWLQVEETHNVGNWNGSSVMRCAPKNMEPKREVQYCFSGVGY